MDRQQLLEIFNRKPRIGALSTTNPRGDVNVGVFGSPQMIDEKTVIMGIGGKPFFQKPPAESEGGFYSYGTGKNG